MTSFGPGLGPPFRRALEVLRTEGPRSLYFKILGETVYRRLALVEKKIAAGTAPFRLAAGMDCRPMQPEDVDDYAASRSAQDRTKALARLHQGHQCILVRRDGHIIHSCWTATERARIDYLECDVRLAPDAVYVYEVFTSPLHRGQSISSTRSRWMEPFFRNRGYGRLVAAVWPENHPAFRTLGKAGYAEVGRIGYWGVGTSRRYFCNYAGDEPGLTLRG